MKVVVTCGPGVAPIDNVRRITNVSTGELGVMLSNAMAEIGARVTCLKSTAATTGLRLVDGVREVAFTTNADVGRLLEEIEFDVVLHAAALADFEIANVRDETGRVVSGGKLSSRAGGVVLHLRPAEKVIAGLRSKFPEAVIVGWKYEVDGGREEALGVARRQLAESGSDGCVVNGAAWGEGFGLLTGDGRLVEFPDRPTLVAGLTEWVAARAG